MSNWHDEITRAYSAGLAGESLPTPADGGAPFERAFAEGLASRQCLERRDRTSARLRRDCWEPDSSCSPRK